MPNDPFPATVLVSGTLPFPDGRDVPCQYPVNAEDVPDNPPGAVVLRPVTETEYSQWHASPDGETFRAWNDAIRASHHDAH